MASIENDDSSLKFGNRKAISRLLIASYIPSGFWSRLMIRILADSQINEVMQHIYTIPSEVVYLFPLKKKKLLGFYNK